MSNQIRQPLVLVVDDDPATSNLIKRNLEDEGMPVAEAATGLDCIRTLHEAKVELIILDLKLPDFNGWGILSLLKHSDLLRNIPVIMISAESPEPPLIERLSPDNYIRKPFDIRDLIVQVRRLIGSRSASK